VLFRSISLAVQVEPRPDPAVTKCNMLARGRSLLYD
jgi:hypothetical protein